MTEEEDEAFKEIERRALMLLTTLESSGVKQLYFYKGKPTGTSGLGEAIVALQAALMKSPHRAKLVVIK
jgi:hypothetical protein